MELLSPILNKTIASFTAVMVVILFFLKRKKNDHSLFSVLTLIFLFL